VGGGIVRNDFNTDELDLADSARSLLLTNESVRVVCWLGSAFPDFAVPTLVHFGINLPKVGPCLSLIFRSLQVEAVNERLVVHQVVNEELSFGQDTNLA